MSLICKICNKSNFLQVPHACIDCPEHYQWFFHTVHVVSDHLSLIQEGNIYVCLYVCVCLGCFFTTSGGLRSFEHPLNEMKAIPRIDSSGQVCGSNFKVDAESKKETTGMPRVGSAANWSSNYWLQLYFLFVSTTSKALILIAGLSWIFQLYASSVFSYICWGLQSKLSWYFLGTYRHVIISTYTVVFFLPENVGCLLCCLYLIPFTLSLFISYINC